MTATDLAMSLMRHRVPLSLLIDLADVSALPLEPDADLAQDLT